MLKNYFKTAWRSLARGRSFSFINISGLAVGMAGATLILLWIFHEVGYDRFHVKGDRIYQLYSMTDIPGLKHTSVGVVSQLLGPAVKDELPEVEDFSRVGDIDHFLFTVNRKSFTGIEGEFVDPGFLRIFSFPLVEGDVSEQLKNVNSIVITEKLAIRLFGTSDAMGKAIRIDSVDNFTVTGVLRDLPSNSTLRFDYLLPMAYMRKIGWNYDEWVSNNIFTAVLLRPDADAAAFNAKIRDFSRVKTGRNDLWLHFAYPLKRWHLYSEFDNGVEAGGRIVTVRIFGIISVFILLIACINFMNLSTARSEQRAKEVGIRKVAGAGRGLLIGQFISEAFLTACIAGVLGLVIVQLALPAFDVLVGSPLRVPYGEIYFWLFASGFIVFTSLLAGSYPAFYLSSFRPAGIFRKQFSRARSAFTPRRILVVLQFSFAVSLIVSTLIVRRQLQYAQDRDTGYSKSDLIYVDLSGEIKKNYPLIRQELLNSDIAVSVTKTLSSMTGGGGNTWTFRWKGEAPFDTTTTFRFFSEDGGLVRTAGLQLVAGRDIDVNRYASDSLAVLLNETAVRTIGFKNPVGQLVQEPYYHRAWHVVGVVKDYINGSPYEKVLPEVIEGAGSIFQTMHIRFDPGQSTASALEKTAQIFRKYNPAYPFDYQFVDQEYARKFENEQRIRTMAGLFAALAVFISCLGLFGLSAFVAESRVKEIGVRKVLGASVVGIARLLSVDFVRLVLLSVAIGSPVAWYVMNRWLQDYSYRIRIGWDVFALAGGLAVVIALVTVSWQAVRAAMANPVKSLRSE